MIADVIVHWLHLMAAMVWVGSLLFMSLVMQPAMRQHVETQYRLALYRQLGRRFSFLQWSAWGLLALTGFYKLWGLRMTPQIFLGPFGRILALKLVLVALMVALSLLHSYRWGPQLRLGPEHPQFGAVVARMTLWGRINLVLLAGIVFCAALLRLNPW